MNVSKVLQCQGKASLCQNSQEAAAALSKGASDGLGGERQFFKDVFWGYF